MRFASLLPSTISAATFIGLTLTVPPTLAADLQSDLKPLLEAKCLACHNPNNPKGDLSLATAAAVLDPEKTLVVPGKPEESDLYLAVIPQPDGEPPLMPKKGEPLNEEETVRLRQWILEGARWPEGVVLHEASTADKSWWAYQPVRKLKHDSIDAYLEDGLSAAGLKMNPPADPRTLMRRASYDLTGLPSTPEEVDDFVQSQDENAYEKLIDRLLESPHYGERWGRHWLDVVRFGESIGFERNVIIDNLWPFRDYVIRSFNEDRPFDQFIREHLAGDVTGKGDPDIAIGSAFLVAGPYDDVGNQDAEAQAQIRANTLDEIINATGEAFLGMTLGCARCHDHKFDPIRQRDYYQLYATFAAVRHGTATLATPAERLARQEALAPLRERKARIEKAIAAVETSVRNRSLATRRRAAHEAEWARPPVDRRGTEERFAPTRARLVRLRCEAADSNPNARTFKLDELEVWSAEESPRNVALASEGATAHGEARINEDFPGVYGPHLAIDGKAGERFLSASNQIIIELKKPTRIHRVVFSSARDEANPEHDIFGGFPADYRIDVSLDGESWNEVAHGRDRQPANEAHRKHRLRAAEITAAEKREIQHLRVALREVEREMTKVKDLPAAWIGTRDAPGADGPFHLFIGGSPQRPGEPVAPASLSTLDEVIPAYNLSSTAPEERRRLALARWITHPDNPLTPRVLANRLWHYHFGKGIVDTPNDFGYMGGRPSHPDLLDFLAVRLMENGWRLKPMHRLIMLSAAYRQSSAFRAEGAAVDGGDRLLWRFPPRRLSAEEIRDTMLAGSGKLDTAMGGPGFRLYRYLNDNVSTFHPLDTHGPETWRRAVYHQNARASVVDLLTDFDQPDCAFSSPRRAQTTTPLQALTMLNHSFTIDMAEALASRVGDGSADEQISRLFLLAYQREPDERERARMSAALKESGLRAVCRAVLNSSELIFLD